MARKRKEPQIPTDMKRLLADRKHGVSSEDLLKDLIDIWGGTKALARDLHADYAAAPAGGMTRQRIIEMLQRLIIVNTDRDLGQQKKPSQLSDEELQDAMAEFLRRVPIHAPASASPEAAPKAGQ